jgi:O-antigen ligase
VLGSLHSPRPRVPWATGALFFLTAVACIPTWLIARDFDRNAAPQFVALSITAIILGALFVLWRSRTALPAILQLAILGLLVASLISLMGSHNVINGLTGDSGRYTGLISLYALLLVALFFSQVSDDQFERVYPWMVAAILLVDVLGVLQALGWITMPGDGGVGSTLGNLDFLSAWVGTSFPLLMWRRINSRAHVVGLTLILVVSLWLMIKIGAKQGPLDFLLLIPAALIYLLRHRIRNLGLSTGIWTGIGTFLFLMWAEAIYLIPMAKLPILGIAGDPNVRIRTDFWYAGFGQFAHHILFGVGPDNYGNYYEKYRTLSSVKLTETVLSNDAHSAMVQTFATLGLAGVLAFVALIVLLIRNLVVLIQSESHRWVGSVSALFALVFFTNSAISPITLPNKLMFWLIAGYVFGAGQRIKPLKVLAVDWPMRIIAAVLVVVVGFVSANFALADIHFVYPGKNYTPSLYLPCTLYFGQELAKSAKSPEVAVNEAKAEIDNNPRCIEAQSFLANYYLQSNNLKAAREPIYALLDIAPGRHEVVRLAAIYALKAKDRRLEGLLLGQGLKLGVLTQS